MLARRPARNLPTPIAGGPMSPLERNPESLKGWKKRESEGVGLGILAKLGKARSHVAEATVEIAIGPSRGPEAGWAARRAHSGSPSGAEEDFQVADFLSCCYLCRKRLHGKDIYMYRGEKAFCSIECRCEHILSDECMENYRHEVISLPDLSSSPCSGGSAGGRGRP